MYTSKKIVLIIDNSKIDRTILKNMLKSEYIIMEAENGKVALDILEKYGARIAVILLDVVMPVMDGFQFLSIKKRKEEISHIPVVVVSQKVEDSHEKRAFDLGATDFISKPFNRVILLGKIALLIDIQIAKMVLNEVERDPLTGVYRAEALLKRTEILLMENPRARYSAICVDIQNFNGFNQNYGVEESDKVLIALGKAGMNFATERKGYFGRLSGDKFIAVIVTSKDSWTDAEALQIAINNKVNSDDIKLNIGVYEIRDRLNTRRSFDKAVYAAKSIKNDCTNNIFIFNNSMNNKMIDYTTLSVDLNMALENNEFELIFQQKNNIITRETIGAEVNVRWRHKNRGLLKPSVFIPIFEKNGMIPLLDRYIWEKTFETMKKWKENGKKLISVSLNVSRKDFYAYDMCGLFMELVNRYDIPIEMIHLEVTESVDVGNSEVLRKQMKELREKGFCIEMDDFGTGYSSLITLSEVEVDYIKLDIGFLKDIKNKRKQIILRNIINMASELQIKLIAEGIENKEEADILIEMGCKYGQGFYYSKPMCSKKFEEFM